jgi:LPS-assembly lipoprotein
MKRFLICCSLMVILTGCGFHLQGERQLPASLQRLYLRTNDPYGHLARNLQQYLKSSNIHLVNSPSEASAQLNIISDEASQDLLSVSSTQQTRQYTLKVTVVFDILDPQGRPLTKPQTLVETRTITVQSNQILGSSNESTLLYQQMRRMLAYAIINRISSQEITQMIKQSSSEASEQSSHSSASKTP